MLRESQAEALRSQRVYVLRDYDGTFSLFDRATGTEKKSFPTGPRQSWGQTLLSPDGKYVVTCTTSADRGEALDGTFFESMKTFRVH